MRILLGLILLLLISSANAQEIPGLTEVSGFVCKNQSDAETIGQAYEKGGQDLAAQVAQGLGNTGKCGTLAQTMWAIQKEVKRYQYQARVIHLVEFDIDGTKVYGLMDKGEILA